MGIAAWIELISLVLKFPSTVLQLVRFLSKTPEEKHQEILKKIEAESAAIDQGGRPSWDV